MYKDERNTLMEKINQATVVSFDVFDTLVFRKVNSPETIFDLVGKHFGIHGFRKLRMNEQDTASRRVYEKFQYPHADMNEIYAVLKEHAEIPVNWDEVKAYEIQMEKDALVANKEMLEIFHYAKAVGKRVVATSDMYLLADTLKEILEDCGFVGFDAVYCSADEHKAKFNRELFELLSQRERVPYSQILHIGDNLSADVEIPGSFGIVTYHYVRKLDNEKFANAPSSDLDKGLYKILYNEKNSFWYNLGIEVGGPLYLGLYLWLEKKIKNSGKKCYFLSRDGYNLFQLFKKAGYENVEYIYMSRRSLIQAGIVDLDEEALAELPPFTFGQTVREVLEYLCIPIEKIAHLEEAEFSGIDDIITTVDDMNRFKKLYVLNRELILRRCEWERNNAKKYFASLGLFDGDALVFDCGWSGSSQHLLERFKKAIGSTNDHYFYYFGIKNTPKSCRQMRGKKYDTYAFDFYRNYDAQNKVNEAIALCELFFSAPEESVFYYDEDGVCLESGTGDIEKQYILDGIIDYHKMGYNFAQKYNVEYSPEMAMGHLWRLIYSPTEKEAVTIGNLQNVDGFARKKGVEKHIAYVTKEQYEDNVNTEIYWMRGFLKRPDISETLKMMIAKDRGIQYPEPALPEYHLEDEGSIRNYYRWLRNCECQTTIKEELGYMPKFSIVIPVYNTATNQLKEAIDSVLRQTYSNYELILVDDHSSWENVVPVLRSYEAHENVTVIYRTTNGHISVATNDGIQVASGDFIVFMDCDDILDPDALYEIARKLNENRELDFIYTDEDKITEDGKIRHMPFFKPDWSPDLFMSMMYTNHLAAYRASITKEIGGLRTAYNGSQDYDFTLRFMEKSDNSRVGHVSKILYHWRERKESVAYAMASKNYAAEASRDAKEDALRRRGVKGHLEYIPGMSQYRTVYDVVGEPLVSIIIPSKDHPEVLMQCINSIMELTEYKNYQIVVVDNGSSVENYQVIKQYTDRHKITYLYEDYEFNFSKMCNIGVKHANGDYLLFLNDDIEVIQPEWLSRMLGAAQQPHIGAVGAKLLYPDTTLIQHSGVSIVQEGPDHDFLRREDSVPYYFGFNWVDRDCIAITGACLMVKKDIFSQVMGYDEQFPIAYNDIDLCFKIHEAGYYLVVRNDVVAYHHESLSRGTDMVDADKWLRLSKERQRLYLKHNFNNKRDPFLNPHMHRYSAPLDYTEKYSKAEKIEMLAPAAVTSGNLDMVRIEGSNISVIGWAFWETRAWSECARCYVVFTDPYGKSYRVEAMPTSRRDVVSFYDNREELLYCGFEAIGNINQIRVDILQYIVSIQLVDENGNLRTLCNKLSTPIVRTQILLKQCNEWKVEKDFSLKETNKSLIWSIDEIETEGNVHKIRGFAFCDGNRHYLYKKELVLLGEDGTALGFETTSEERLDVSLAFPQISYLYNTGFECIIYDKVLDGSMEYEIVIRSIDIMDECEVHDVRTGVKIRSKNS